MVLKCKNFSITPGSNDAYKEEKVTFSRREGEAISIHAVEVEIPDGLYPDPVVTTLDWKFQVTKQSQANIQDLSNRAVIAKITKALSYSKDLTTGTCFVIEDHVIRWTCPNGVPVTVALDEIFVSFDSTASSQAAAVTGRVFYKRYRPTAREYSEIMNES